MLAITCHWLAGWREEVKLPEPLPIFQPHTLILLPLIVTERDFVRGPPVVFS